MLFAFQVVQPVHAADGQRTQATPLLISLLEYCVEQPYSDGASALDIEQSTAELAQIVAESIRSFDGQIAASDLHPFADEHFECGVVAKRTLYDAYVLREEIDQVKSNGVADVSLRCHWDYSDEFPKSLSCNLPKVQTSDGTEYQLRLFAGISIEGFAILGVFPRLQISPEGFIHVF